MEVRKEFWDKSKTLINYCTEQELGILKARVEKEQVKRCTEWSKKAEVKNKPYKPKRLKNA